MIAGDSSRSRSFANWVVARPFQILGCALLLSLAAAAGIVHPFSGEPRLRIDPSLDKMLPQADEAGRFHRALIERFGSDDVLVIALRSEDLFTAEALGSIVAVTERLQELESVHHVESLANALRLRALDGDLEISEFLEEVPTHPAELAALRQAVLDDPLRAGSLVSRDGSTAAVILTFEPIGEARFLAERLDLQVLDIARREAPDMQVWLAGTPHIKAEVARLLESELGSMVPLVLVLMILVSFAFFRDLRIALAPIVSVLLGLLWTLGLMGWAGHTLNIVTTLIPPLVLALGFAYAAHVAAGFRSSQAEGGLEPAGRSRARRSLEHVAFPVLFTALTTAAGFLSLCTNSLEVIRGFGFWAAISAGVTMLASLTVIPALLCLGSAPVERTALENQSLDRAFGLLAPIAARFARPMLGIGLLVFVASVAAATRIEVNLAVIENFRADSEIRRSYEAINRLFGGANQFYILLEAERSGAFEEPEVLRAVADLQGWLGAQPEIGSTLSLVQYVELLHEALVEDAATRRVPDSRDLVAQLLLFGGNEELDVLTDPAHRFATILVRSSATETLEFDRLARRIDRQLASLPEGITGRATGDAILLTRASHRISRGQATSLISAAALIGVLLVLFFRSLRLGLYALLPNALPVAIYFGALGATGITLNNATALMGSIVLGVAVDDTLHLIIEYQRALPELQDPPAALARALRRVGRAISCTTVALCLGLLVVGGSALRNQAEFGLLGAATLAIAWLVNVTFTPALCARLIR